MDFGCGTGLNSLALKQWGNVTSVDTSPHTKQFCKKRGINVVIKDILATKTTQWENKFDLIIALDVLEHIKQDEEIMKKLHSYLKPKGRLVLTVPAHPYLWSSHDVALHHQRRYTRKELKHKLHQATFDIQLLSYYHFFIYPLALLRSLLNPKGSSTDKTYTAIPLHKVYYLERWLIRKKLVPNGTSLLCIAKK